MSSGFLGGGMGPMAIRRKMMLPAPVPVAGAELLVNGDMETGDPPTGWSGASATVASVAEERTGGAGSKSMRVTNAGGASGWGFRGITVANGTWLQANGWGKSETATAILRIINASFSTIASSANAAATWTSLLATGRLSTANGYFAFIAIGADTLTCLGDDASVKPLTLSSLISTRPYTSADCDLSVGVTRTAGTQAGISARVDSATSPANFIIAYLDGAGNVKVDKCVGGTYTNVISGAVTYSAGATLRLTVVGATVTAYYAGAMVGTAQVTDAGIASNTLHGLFSTYAANTFTNYRNRKDEWTTSEAAPVPVAGADIVVNGTMETGSPPTGWSGSVATVAADADAYAGAQALRVTNSGASSGWGYRGITPGIGTWLQFGGWGKKDTAAASIAVANSGYSKLGTATNSTVAWAALLFCARSTSATGYIVCEASGTDTLTALFDNVYVLPLTLPSLFSTRPYASANCDLSVAITRTAGTQAGFVARLDSATSPANFIIAYLDSAGYVKVDKCVAGVYTNVISGAVTYGAGKVLRLVCSGNSVSAYYNGTQVDSTVTVSDAGIVSNTRHGLFSTYASNSFAGYVAA